MPAFDPSKRATSWQLRTRTLQFGRHPLLMGIVNVTPDSFSDGGQFFDPQAAIDHALKLLDDGADILDIGGESTRPYSTMISAEEELRRVIPIIEAIVRDRPQALISIDTSKAVVAEAAIAAGADIINDVTGLAGDPAMIGLAKTSAAGVCVMHMQGTPQTMQDNPFYDDVVDEIFEFLCQRRDELIAAGVDRQRICLDPGIGFGKTNKHNITLMANCWRLHDLGCPLLVGHSRKAFIGKLIGDKMADRTFGTIGGALALALQGVQIIRVHDVAAVRQAMVLFEASGGLDRADNL
ncbi:MAG TPA: dihydropteroate synthase [Pirellulaceae bacterium]|jgi:dihydropteroate synthase